MQKTKKGLLIFYKINGSFFVGSECNLIAIKLHSKSSFFEKVKLFQKMKDTIIICLSQVKDSDYERFEKPTPK